MTPAQRREAWVGALLCAVAVAAVGSKSPTLWTLGLFAAFLGGTAFRNLRAAPFVAAAGIAAVGVLVALASRRTDEILCRVAVAAVAVPWSARPWRARAAGLTIAAEAALFAGLARVDALPRSAMDVGLPLLIVALVFVAGHGAIGARRVAFALPLVAWLLMSDGTEVVYPSWSRYSTSIVLRMALAPWMVIGAGCVGVVAARVHRFGTPVMGRDFTRLLVLAQQHPWRGSAAMACGAMYIGVLLTSEHRLHAAYGWSLLDETATAYLALTCVAAAATGHLVAETQRLFDRLAPLVLTVLASNVVAVLALGADAWLILVCTALLVASQAIAPWFRPAERRVPEAVVAVAIVLVALLAPPADAPGLWILWFPAVPVAFHLVVASDLTERALLAGAPLVGAMAGAARWLIAETHGLGEQVVTFACAWALAGVLAVVARRARLLTAVPADHPIRVDFAVPRG